MNKLLIVGAGGWGRVVRHWAMEMQMRDPRWESVKFLDDNSHALDKYSLKNEIVGSIESYQPSSDEEFVCGIGDPIIKLKICEKLQSNGAVFINIIHPNSLVTGNGEFGTGIIVSPFAGLILNTAIGDFVTVNAFSIIGHDATIERGCTLSAHCDIMANVHLEEGVFLGSGARILPNLRIGRNARVGAGAVVIRNVLPGTTVFGNPAKEIY